MSKDENLWFINNFCGHNFYFAFQTPEKCLVSYKCLHVTTITSFPLNQRAQNIWKCWMMFELLWYKRENLDFYHNTLFIFIYLYLSILTYNFSSNNTREYSTHGHHQMVNTKIRLIIFFAAKDGEALYSQQKQDWELTVAQITNSLLPNSDLNWRK